MYLDKIFKDEKYKYIQDFISDIGISDCSKPEIMGEFSGVTKTLKEATSEINKRNLILPNIIRDYDARAIPFEQWEDQING